MARINPRNLLKDVLKHIEDNNSSYNERVLDFHEWKLGKKWLGGFAILQAPKSLSVMLGVNFYREKDTKEIVALLSRTNRRRALAADKSLKKSTERVSVALDAAAYIYASFNKAGLEAHIKDNDKRDSCLKIKKFKELVAVEML